MSRPAQSRPWAMRDYPRAREREVEALLELAQLEPGVRVVDLQAADGYLSDCVQRRLGGRAHCICVEPSPLRSRIAPSHQVSACALHDIHEVADGSIDRVLGLAGLHHAESPAAVLQEAARMLRSGGLAVICDVERGSPMDGWLNDFVDRHHPGGHDGRFFTVGELAGMFRDAGLVEVAVERRRVPWSFASFDDLVRFCRGLFGLDCPQPVIARGVRERLQVRETEEGAALQWQLLYARGRAPA